MHDPDLLRWADDGGLVPEPHDPVHGPDLTDQDADDPSGCEVIVLDDRDASPQRSES